jgi:hypothetical protein
MQFNIKLSEVPSRTDPHEFRRVSSSKLVEEFRVFGHLLSLPCLVLVKDVLQVSVVSSLGRKSEQSGLTRSLGCGSHEGRNGLCSQEADESGDDLHLSTWVLNVYAYKHF